MEYRCHRIPVRGRTKCSPGILSSCRACQHVLQVDRPGAGLAPDSERLTLRRSWRDRSRGAPSDDPADDKLARADHGGGPGVGRRAVSPRHRHLIEGARRGHAV
jgi:hypothetical protein